MQNNRTVQSPGPGPAPHTAVGAPRRAPVRPPCSRAVSIRPFPERRPRLSAVPGFVCPLRVVSPRRADWRPTCSRTDAMGETTDRNEQVAKSDTATPLGRWQTTFRLQPCTPHRSTHNTTQTSRHCRRPAPPATPRPAAWLGWRWLAGLLASSFALGCPVVRPLSFATCPRSLASMVGVAGVTACHMPSSPPHQWHQLFALNKPPRDQAIYDPM